MYVIATYNIIANQIEFIGSALHFDHQSKRRSKKKVKTL